MMSIRCKIAALFSIGILSACSTLPMPEDVTGVRTEDIVQHIRCEARDATVSAVLKFLSNQESRHDLQQMEVSEFEIFEKIRKKYTDKYSLVISIYNEIQSKPRSQQTYFDETLLKYAKAVIAFEFTLTMLANNTNFISAAVAHPFTTGTFGVSLTSKGNFARQNLLNFRVADQFGTLISNENNDICKDAPIINSFYPIVGQIGMDKIINTAVYLNELESLTVAKDGDTSKIFSANITFTTTISQEFDPKLAIGSRGHFVQLSALEVDSLTSRMDTDNVSVSIAIPIEPTPVSKPKIAVPQKSATPNVIAPPAAQTPPQAEVPKLMKLPASSPATTADAIRGLDELKATINGTNFANVVKQLNN